MLACASLSVATSLPGGTASAQAAGAEASRQEVYRLLQQSLQLRERHEDDAALELAERAYALQPTAFVLAQVALAQAALGHWAQSYAGLRRALAAADPDLAPYREQLQHDLQGMQPNVVQLSLDVEPAGARVIVNGIDEGGAPLSESVVVAPGVVSLQVRMPGFIEQTLSWQLDAGATVAQTVRLQPVPPAPVEETPAPPRVVEPRVAQAVEPPLPSYTAAYVLTAVTVALTAGAVATGVLSLDRAAEFRQRNDDPRSTKPQRDAARDRAATMQALNAGLVAAALVSGGVSVYLFVDPPLTHASRSAPQAAAFALLRGRF